MLHSGGCYFVTEKRKRQLQNIQSVDFDGHLAQVGRTSANRKPGWVPGLGAGERVAKQPPVPVCRRLQPVEVFALAGLESTRSSCLLLLPSPLVAASDGVQGNTRSSAARSHSEMLSFLVPPLCLLLSEQTLGGGLPVIPERPFVLSAGLSPLL